MEGPAKADLTSSLARPIIVPVAGIAQFGRVPDFQSGCAGSRPATRSKPS